MNVQAQDWMLLLIRLTLGAIFISHGYPKFVGRSQKMEVSRERLTHGLGELGLPFPESWAIFVGAVHLLGGFLLALGLFSPWVPLVLAFTMLVAAPFIFRKAGFAESADFPTLILVVTVALIVFGMGRFTIANLLR